METLIWRQQCHTVWRQVVASLFAWIVMIVYIRLFYKHTKIQQVGLHSLRYLTTLSYFWLTLIKNITTQSVASPRTPHLSMILPIMTSFTFELWPPKSIGFTMVNMSAKFDEEVPNSLVCIRLTAYFHMCPLRLWPWPLTSDLQNY